MLKSSKRAAPLSPEERKASIVAAATPLVIEHGRDVTTRQIAQAAGIAEGTIFRVFDDKESILQEVVRTYLDPKRFSDALQHVDTGTSLEQTLVSIFEILNKRFGDIAVLMRALKDHMALRRPEARNRQDTLRVIEGLLEPYADQLAWPVDEVTRLIRLVAFAGSFPDIAHGNSGMPRFTAAEQAKFFLNGVAKHP